MKKVLILLSIIALSSCSYFLYDKNNEEVQYFSFNEKTKLKVRKDEIYLTKVTKSDTLSEVTADIKSKYGNSAKLIGSWEFSQRPSKELKDEITNKAIEFGSNHIVMFEKKDCYNLDKKNEVEVAKSGFNCYRIFYYTQPDEYKNNKETKSSKAVETLAEPNNGSEVKK